MRRYPIIPRIALRWLLLAGLGMGLGLFTCGIWAIPLITLFQPHSLAVLLGLALAGYVMICLGQRLTRHFHAAQGCLALRRLPSARLAAASRHLVPAGDIFELPSATPQAFCLGLWHPRIYVSTGLVHGVTAASLRAIVAHEEAHRRRRDPLRHFAWQSLAALFPRGSGLAWVAERAEVRAEVAADRFARACTSTPALAAALLHLLRASQPESAGGKVMQAAYLVTPTTPPVTAPLQERLAYLTQSLEAPLPPWRLAPLTPPHFGQSLSAPGFLVRLLAGGGVVCLALFSSDLIEHFSCLIQRG